MHQSHNIPWHLISSNFEFKENDRSLTPPFSGFISKKNPNASQELKHFVRKFALAIRTFSDTERAKYPDHKLQSEGNVFSDELKKKYPKYMNDTNQRIEYWIQSAKPHYTEDLDYDYPNGDLGDIVKILLYENELSSLIMMAHHPKIPIARLLHLGWGNRDFGFSSVKDTALRAYLFFNVAEATNSLANGEYTHSDEYGPLLAEVGVMWMDYRAQQIPHQLFLRSCGVEYDRINRHDDREWARDLYLHKDFGLLKEYVKMLFALLYRYDLLLRECALEPGWELEIARSYPINRVIKDCWDSDYLA